MPTVSTDSKEKPNTSTAIQVSSPLRWRIKSMKASTWFFLAKSKSTGMVNPQAKNLYIIAGCNGAGETTASMTILPEILDCYEFVNADEIAKGLSPFHPEKVAIEAGRLMLGRNRDFTQCRENIRHRNNTRDKILQQPCKPRTERWLYSYVALLLASICAKR